jgi:hypothetical protein
MRNRKQRWPLAGAMIAFIALAAPAAAKEVVWAKTGANVGAMQAQIQICTDEARLIAVGANTSRIPGLPPGAGSQLIAAIVGGGFSAALTPRARSEYVHGCMVGRGFGAIDLSPAEESELARQITPDARASWIAVFYQRADFEQRSASAQRPVLDAACATDDCRPRGLPRGQTEPFTVGGARIDPATLVTPTGEVDGRGAILSGRITHRRTGRLTKSAPDAAFRNFRFADDLIVHQVLATGEHGEARETYWCGRIVKTGLGNVNEYCLWADDGGVTVYMGMHQEWLNTPALSEDSWYLPSANFSLKESADDLIGPMDFGLHVTKVGKGGVRVLAEATLNGKFEDFWTADIPLDEAGRAVLPLWTYPALCSNWDKNISRI